MFKHEDRRFLASFTEFNDPNPNPGNRFGDTIVPLSTGNSVITSPFDDAGGTDAGAVDLFNAATGALISTLTGSADNDQIGSSGVSGPVTATNCLVGSATEVAVFPAQGTKPIQKSDRPILLC